MRRHARGGGGIVDEDVRSVWRRSARRASTISSLWRAVRPRSRRQARCCRARRRIRRGASSRAGRHGRQAAIMAALVAAVRNTPSIRVIEGYAAERSADRRRCRHRRQLRKAADAGGHADRHPGARHRARHRRHRPSLCGDHQSAEAGASALPSPRAPVRSSPIPNSCSSIRPRSMSAAIPRRSRPKRCAAKARSLINGKPASASCWRASARRTRAARYRRARRVRGNRRRARRISRCCRSAQNSP
jgi:hypothetical protein